MMEAEHCINASDKALDAVGSFGLCCFICTEQFTGKVITANGKLCVIPFHRIISSAHRHRSVSALETSIECWTHEIDQLCMRDGWQW